MTSLPIAPPRSTSNATLAVLIYYSRQFFKGTVLVSFSFLCLTMLIIVCLFLFFPFAMRLSFLY